MRRLVLSLWLVAGAMLLSGCGGRPQEPTPAANEIGVVLRAGEPEIRWYRLDAAVPSIRQLRVGVNAQGGTNWTIVLWDGVWKTGWTSSVARAPTAPFRVQGCLATPSAGDPAACSVTVACTLAAPMRVRSALGEGFVPAGLHLLDARHVPGGRGWDAGLPVVMTSTSVVSRGWLGRKFLGQQACAELAYAQRTNRMESRMLFINPDLRAVIRTVNAVSIAKQNAIRPVHEIQAVLGSTRFRFRQGPMSWMGRSPTRWSSGTRLPS